MTNLDFWYPTYVAMLGFASVLTPAQQQKLQITWNSLADLMEKKGDTTTSYFLHALAQDTFVERPKTQLRVVK